ncbi:MAG: beta-galactosidase trimerization domain-containing protein [Clostridiales bacterium]|nr:beta-galactosidase trimerization domain-containing protein [Clostridiales bacterium]
MELDFRQVHLDFHTSEKIDKIGESFDKRQFQEALKKGHINSITLFSKCHHGWSYHPTEANEMHPGLKFDLLGAQIEAAHEIGVKTPVYLSAGLDEKTALRHRNWLVRNKDETTTWVSDFTQPGYHKLCMASPYLECLLRQIEEVCRLYDADGIFLDIAGVQPCYCQSCIAEREAMGLDPYDEEAVLYHAEQVYFRYAKAVRAAIDKYKPGLALFHNGGHIRQGRRDLAHCNTHLELESLPTGGWGYDHFPCSARYCQGLNMEYLGMTGKFHSTWGEFGGFKHPNALRYEVSLAAANGAKCSVGDQLCPNGKMDMVTYGLIGEAYAELEAKEPWLKNVSPAADIAVISPEAYTDNLGTGQTTQIGASESGAVRIMLEGKYLFDVVDFETDIDKYKLVILPDIIRADKRLEEKLKQFCKNGGKVLASGKSALKTEEDKFCLDLGAEYICKNPYSPDYFRPSVQIAGMGDTGYVMYGSGEKIRSAGTELGIRENPYFNRTREHFCSHRHTPDSAEYGGGGMTEGRDGIYIAWSIFEDYGTNGGLWAKQMVMFAADRLLGDKKTLKVNLPAQGIVTLMRQGERYICHLLYASPVKRGNGIEVVEDIVPIYDINVKIKTDKKPGRVYLAPQAEDIPFEYKNGEVSFWVKKLECHQMAVIE